MYGNLPRFEADRLGFLMECARDYGGYVRYSRRILLLNDLHSITKVLQDNGEQFAIPKNFLQQRVSTSRVEEWLQGRANLSSGLRAKQLGRVSELAAESLDWVLAKHQSSLERHGCEAVSLLEQATSRTISTYLFGAEGGRRLPPLAQVLLDALSPRIGNPFVIPGWLPTPMNRLVVTSLNDFTSEIHRLLAIGVTNSSTEPALAKILARVNDGKMSSKSLEMMLAGVLLAAHRVPAAALGWLLDLTRISGIANDQERRHHQVAEALRLYPPTWLLERRTTRDTVVGGWRLKRNHTVLISPYVVHRSPSNFDQPGEFIPTRWQPGTQMSARSSAYMPFGKGPRGCPGGGFSLTMLNAMSHHFQCSAVKCAPGRPFPDPTTTLAPRGLTLVAS